MIVSPVDWKQFYKVNPDISFLLSEIRRSLLYDLDCTNLSYSGGIDSTIILYLLREIHGRDIQTYTIAVSKEHPDYMFAQRITSELGIPWRGILIDTQCLEEEEFVGDAIVKQFYWFLREEGVESIIACDGIDEYMGGYYDHLHQPNLMTYYYYLSELVSKHLIPLHENSGEVKVYLPYLYPNLVGLYGNYELSARFDMLGRKKIMVQLAKVLGIPEWVINRRKYGFCDAGIIKGD